MCAAAVCAGAAAWLLAGREHQGRRRARLLLAGGPAADWPPRWSWTGVPDAVRRHREWLCVPAGLLLAVLAASVVPAVLGALAVPLVRRKLGSGARRQERDRRAEAVVALCGAVAGELRAGLQPGQALRTGARSTGALGDAEPAVLAAARFGGDVPEALRDASRQDGAEGLAGMAACWQVAVDSGAGLAAGLDRLEAALRAEREQREELRAQLAGAQSTVVLLALLPAAGLAMGWALGADPLRVLFHTPAGYACLVAGGLLEAAGLLWAGRIVRAGEAS
ncbi:type II secretion system F family protein [Streptomyces sp. NPDC005805]|uniref:type II secretion system F family protein n=1 Tax=Streptomyces sp. NPDC005805 TaxID=3157068 RepID=UPI0033D61C93